MTDQLTKLSQIKQARLARELGLSQSTISRKINGIIPIYAGEALYIAQLTGVPLSVICRASSK